jgi:hypothetical protein
LERIEQLRIDRLLQNAAAFRQAAEIRQYVEAIRRNGSSATSASEIELLCRWALEQADRIDPVVSQRFPLDS